MDYNRTDKNVVEKKTIKFVKDVKCKQNSSLSKSVILSKKHYLRIALPRNKIWCIAPPEAYYNLGG